MSQSFAEMLAQSGNIDELNQQLDNATKKRSFQKDLRFWKPGVDKAENGDAVIRFLPKTATDPIYFVEVRQHSIQGPNGWFIEECPYTIGHDCPVCKANKKYYDLSKQGDKIAEGLWNKRKAKTSYIYNILVIDDPFEPENNGKNFLWKVPFTVHGKILEKINPPKSTTGKTRQLPKPVLDPINGYNFFLQICRGKGGWRSYDGSQFDEKSSAIFDGDLKKIQALWESEYPLAEFKDPTKFLSADELYSKYLKALGESPSEAKTEAPSRPAKAPVEIPDDAPATDEGPDDSETDATPEPEKAPAPAEPAGGKEAKALAAVRERIAKLGVGKTA